MRILFFGDIFGEPGRDALRQILPSLKEKYKSDIVIGNIENIAHGRGITEKSLKEVLQAGLEWGTGGNHAFDHEDAWKLFADNKLPILRPANFPSRFPGRGLTIIQVGVRRLLLLHLVGKVTMRPELINDPIECVDNILQEYSLRGQGGEKEEVDAIIIDWHAAATSEKQMLGWYLDGKVSAILGTHTHVQTADERILPQGTAFITDVGMVGPQNSVIGIEPEFSIRQFKSAYPMKLEPAKGPVVVNAICIEVDDATGKTLKIERIMETVPR